MQIGQKAEKEVSDSWIGDIEHSVSTYENFNYIEVGTTFIVPPTSPKPTSSLKMHNETLTWSEALKTCNEEGAHLLVINSWEEARRVDHLILNSSSLYLRHWIGVHDLFGNDNFYTIFHTSLESTGYANWRNGQPDDLSIEDCLYYIYNDGIGNIACDDKYPFVCEEIL
ncbi:Hemolymph lipopolysaccharide-binding protein [Blattella germanica]|nr:Hemolymph lipopolysaccharide-binding protein [Blattella germanica]